MSNQELTAALGPLKRAAVDAYMKSQPGDWNIVGDKYENRSRNTLTTVSAPDATTGAGGGDWRSDVLFATWMDQGKDADYEAAFDGVRSTIDSLFNPWLSIPDPENLRVNLESCRDVTQALSGEQWKDGETTRPAGGELHEPLRSIERNIAQVQGRTWDAFRINFLGQLTFTVGGLLTISVLRGGVVTSQREIWNAARADVLEVVKKGLNGFNKVSTGSGFEFQQVFEVVDWAVEGVKQFAPGLVDGLIDGIEYISNGKDFLFPDKVDEPGSTYDGVLKAIRKALKALSESIENEEMKLISLMEYETEYYYNKKYRGNYDPHSDDQKGGTETFSMNESVRQIAERSLPAVAVELNRVADLNAACGSETMVQRDSSIGRGPNGPASHLVNLNELLHKLLEDLAGDAVDGAKSLTLALNDFQMNEENIIQHLNTVAADIIAGGRNYDGENLGGDLSNVTRDRERDPLYPKIGKSGKPGFGPNGSLTLEEVMSGK
ncbi:hypothetical protein [Leucobacter coleopterorum]|uniref:hypothetical protein n=1 Tax=Leucobacter coleopterorum TaxID=2714933 RepID=UPI001FCB1F8D|nr:hypothetical protein [Leucobacter coleopterorum]